MPATPLCLDISFARYGGLAIGFQGASIHQIWEWMMMALSAGVIVPNVLRWYWWRLNGWGYAAGTLAGMALSVLQLIYLALAVWVAFPIIVGACADLAPMYLVGHWHTHALICLALATAGTVVLKYTWYNHLPSAE